MDHTDCTIKCLTLTLIPHPVLYAGCFLLVPVLGHGVVPLHPVYGYCLLLTIPILYCCLGILCTSQCKRSDRLFQMVTSGTQGLCLISKST